MFQYDLVLMLLFKSASSAGDADHIVSTYNGFWFLVDLTARPVNAGMGGGPVSVDNPPSSSEAGTCSSDVEVV